jgi:Mn-containing catalase
MFLSINKLPNNIPQGDKPNPKAAQALQEASSNKIRAKVEI